VRDDVSDTLPGVAIAISLVPPLAVVGLTLESGAPKQALGALLLFLTNFGAILLTGLIVMAIYRVRATAVHGLGSTRGHPRLAVAVVVTFVIVVAAPLAVDSAQITSPQLTNSNVTTVANNWADKTGWQVVNVSTTESGVTVRAIGPLPVPDPPHIAYRAQRERTEEHISTTRARPTQASRPPRQLSPDADPSPQSHSHPPKAWSVPRRSGLA
jgi:uncharacterized membrane protein